MSPAPLLLLAALWGWSDPEALVADLASPDAAVREEAEGSLEELGRPALPALYGAREAEDPDHRRRVGHLIGLIERQRLLRATRVRLDFEDAPLSEVAEAIEAQAGFSVALCPEDKLRTRRVTLHTEGALPLWEAIDRLGASCAVRPYPGLTLGMPVLEPTLWLGPAEGPPVPASDAGPFRTYLVHISRHRRVIPARPPAKVRTEETLKADLLVVAEPGMAIQAVGPATLDEITDGDGRDVRPVPPFGPSPHYSPPPRFEDDYAKLIRLHIPLDPAAERGGRLRRFRGHVPVTVRVRAGDPIVVPLIAPDGPAVSRRGLTLGVSDLRRDEEQKLTSFTMTIHPPLPEPTFGPPPTTIPLGEYHPPISIEDHVQFQDSRGRLMRWGQSQGWKTRNGRSELPMIIASEPGESLPARLLYHDVIGAATEVVFDFTDVPLP